MYLSAGADETTSSPNGSFDWKPIVYIAVGTVLAGLMSSFILSKTKRRRRSRPVKMLSPRPLQPSKYEVVVGNTISRHRSQRGAVREANRFTRRGFDAKIKEIP